jgi:hypothetical protein
MRNSGDWRLGEAEGKLERSTRWRSGEGGGEARLLGKATRKCEVEVDIVNKQWVDGRQPKAMLYQIFGDDGIEVDSNNML